MKPTARKIGAIAILFFLNFGFTYFLSHIMSQKGILDPVFSEKASFVK